MSLNLQQKQAVVADLAVVAGRAHSAIAAEYAGLSVAQLTELRRQARGAGVYLKVVRNTLARRALEQTSFECMREKLVGPLILAFAEEDPGAPARLFRDFAKTSDKLVVRAIGLSGRLLEPSALDALASMPTRDQALSQLLAVMKAPVEKFVRTLAEPHGKLVRTVAAIRDQKQAA